jgi:hypothetical protein
MRLSKLVPLASAGLLAFSATSLVAKRSHAFDAVPYAEVPKLVGKPVYAASNKVLSSTQGKEAVVFAGDALTLVEAKPFGDKGQFNYLKVRTKDGIEGEIQVRFLSKTPLAYQLRTPGAPKVLMKNLLADAYPLGQKLHAVREKHGYDVSMDAAEDYHFVDATQESLDFTRTVLHALVYGSNRSKMDLVKEEHTRWLGGADATMLEWYAQGIPDAKTKQNFVSAVFALNDLNNAHEAGSQMANALSEKKEKRWTRELEGVPAPARSKIEAEKVKELDDTIASSKKKIAAAFASAAKNKAAVR